MAKYYFAQHAAFPLALTPDLLYRLWAGFQRTPTNANLNIPWLAVADLLLSPLCQETDVGYELYEMDLSIRAQLLDELRDNPYFGSARIEELATFLRDYVQEQLKSSDPVILDLAQSQRWTALAYTRPDQTAKELAEILKIYYNNGGLEQVRIASLLETFGTLSEPLAALEGFEPLLTYAQEQAHSALGHTQVENTPARIRQATKQVSRSLGVDLPTYREERASEESESNIQQPNTITPISIFISYAREEEDLLNQLDVHLTIFKHEQLITNWHDRQILPGTDWSVEIDAHLEQSRLILLLISPYFMASDYVYGIEMKRALELHESGEARVIPIILRPTDWEDAPFNKLQFLPSNARPISRWPDRDNAFKDIAEELRKVIRELQILPETYDEALIAYQGARRLQPQNRDTLFALGRLYNDTNDYEQAIDILNQLIELQPEFAEAYKQRGLVYRRQADAAYAATENYDQRTIEYYKAIADLQRAVELRPDFEDALGSLGGLYRRMEEYERAIEYYQRLYEVNPSSSYALGNLASLLWYLGRIEDARIYFNLLEKAAQARIEEGKDEAYWDYYDLALGQLATGEMEVARETYAKAIEETPAIAQLDAVLSNLYFLQRALEHIEGLEEIIAMIENAKDVKGDG